MTCGRVCGIPVTSERKGRRFYEKTWRQWEHSLYQSLRKTRLVSSKSREFPSPEGEREANVGPVGFWQHGAPRHQIYNDCFCSRYHFWLSPLVANCVLFERVFKMIATLFLKCAVLRDPEHKGTCDSQALQVKPIMLLIPKALRALSALPPLQAAHTCKHSK
eukprot:1161929-Pelagomonas_calceolata.AAC.8